MSSIKINEAQIQESQRNQPFGDCHNDPLHVMGRVQQNGALVAVHVSGFRIAYCSANLASILGREPDEVLGQEAEKVFSFRWPELLQLAVERGILRLSAGPFPKSLNVVAHQQGDYMIYEFELAADEPANWWNYGERVKFLLEMGEARTLDQCRSLVVRWLFQRSQFDRVLFYDFLPDMHGEVVQELCKPGIDSYLGLHFPASDIPPSAQRLYTINWQRIIADVNSTDVQLLSWGPDAPPLDLTRSMLRAVHPAHIHYLKNMGVQASFSISIIVKDALHGMVVCHNNTPLSLSLSDRLAFEEIARMVSMHLQTLLELLERDTRAKLRAQLSRLEGGMASTRHDAKTGLTRHLGLMRELLSAGGVWLRFAGNEFTSGSVPDATELEQLGEWIKTFPRGEVSSCRSLPCHLVSFPGIASLACGILFIPIGDEDFVALLRPEMMQTITWAGKPQDPDFGDEILPLTPRNSFAAWVEKTRYHSEAWTEIQKDFAEELREDLLNYISRAHLEKIALHDPLTGLPNRQLFDQRLQESVDQFLVTGSYFAVHMLDLDKFKPVNDTLGHAAGDQLLQEVARRLMKLARHDDTVARLGGDEFAVLQTGIAQDQGAIALAEKMVQLISEPYYLESGRVEIGVSIGIATCPHDSANASELIQLSDIALYDAKRTGRNRYSRYTPGMKL